MSQRGNTIITLGVTFKKGERLPESVVLTEDNQVNNHNSFFDKDERELVNDLFGESMQQLSAMSPPQLTKSTYRRLMTDKLGLSENAWCATNSNNPDFVPGNKLPGDIDVLLCEPFEFSKAIAIEVKAIREQGGKANKLNKLEKGCRQAEGLLAMGFHQVYLAVVVELYGRDDRDNQNMITRQDRKGLMYIQVVEELLREFHLSDAVGILVIEAVQLGGHDYKFSGRVTVNLIRQAEKRLHQTARATEIVKGLS
ncbi:MAG: hypothetical protein ACOVSW_22715 [Candidatus Kapaibacteriota bacterium]